MTINTIAIQSPGDMGHEIGRLLVNAGYKVVSALEGRSKRTRALAKSGGIIDVGKLENLYDDIDVLLSYLIEGGYQIETHLTEVFIRSKVYKESNLICVISKN